MKTPMPDILMAGAISHHMDLNSSHQRAQRFPPRMLNKLSLNYWENKNRMQLECAILKSRSLSMLMFLKIPNV